MPRSYLTNAVDVALAQPVQPGDGSIIVDDAAPLPATPFYLVIDPFSDTDREYCYCTNVTGTTLTVTRNLDGSQGQIHGATDIVRISYVAQILDDLWDAVSAATGLPVGGVLGDSLRKASSSAGDGEWRDNMFFGATAPLSPMVGDLWHNPADDPSTDFLSLGGGTLSGAVVQSGSQTLATKQFRNITVSATSPAAPLLGDIWLDIS